MIIVKEYRPSFFDSDEPLRSEEVENPEDALEIPWIKEKGGCFELMEWGIRRPDKWIVALFEKK